jgi:predicted dithiol-disulfide oxidoreductase (DUF899 family)
MTVLLRRGRAVHRGAWPKLLPARRRHRLHTYSNYARGAEMTGGSYYYLDLTALGRQEDWEEPKGRLREL